MKADNGKSCISVILLEKKPWILSPNRWKQPDPDATLRVESNCNISTALKFSLSVGFKNFGCQQLWMKTFRPKEVRHQFSLKANVINKSKTKEVGIFSPSMKDVVSCSHALNPDTTPYEHSYGLEWVALRQVNSLTLFDNGNHCTLNGTHAQTCRQLTVVHQYLRTWTNNPISQIYTFLVPIDFENSRPWKLSKSLCSRAARPNQISSMRSVLNIYHRY